MIAATTMMGTAFLTLWYTFLILVFQGVSSQQDVLAHGTDVLAYAGQLLVPGFLGRALPLAVLIAVLGTSQIQMVEPSRVLYSMARDRLIPRFFGVPQQAPDSLGRPRAAGRDPAAAPDPVPGQQIGHQGHRLRDQRVGHARAVHVLRDRAEQRLVLPLRAAAQPRGLRWSAASCR
jgi:hypothetical protein